MKQCIIFAAILFFGLFSQAQVCTNTVNGHVEDADTKEKLIGATIQILELNKETTSTANGDFVFDNICEGNYSLIISHVGCVTVTQKLTIKKSVHVEIFLPHQKGTLNTVTVTSTKATTTSGFKKELSGKLLEQTKGLTISEALSKINGVTLLQTGSTVSKPIIHGLHSSRILTINNGVRQEGQQWGNEHAPEIDPFIADKLTVIKGVDELKYGSDAIGGVILVEPKALRTTAGFAAELNTVYFSNNRQYVVSGMYEQQLKAIPALSFRVQGTYKKGANSATPNYRLNNTGSTENNFSLTSGYKKNNFSSELFYSRFDTKLGIFKGSHIGNITDLKAAIAANKPNDVFLGEDTYAIGRPYQAVTHNLIKSKTIVETKNGDKISFLLSAQFNNRSEFDIVRSSRNTSPQLSLDIRTYAEELVWEKHKKNNFVGTAGASFVQQNNTYAGRYFIPNYNLYSYGGYYVEKWQKNKWELQGGIRYDYKNIQTNRLKFNGTVIDYGFNFSTLASSINAIYKPNTNWRTNIAASLASRAPQVNELLSDGIHHGTATYELGDIFLETEKAINIGAGITYQNDEKTFTAEVNVYNNNINNFIFRQPIPNEPVLTIAGAFPKIIYNQTNAVLRGIDVSTTTTIAKQVDVNIKYSMLRATNKNINDWLILMPADRVSAELNYTFKNNHFFHDSYIATEVQYVFEQTRVPSDKNGLQDYKAPPGAYTIVNLNASTILHFKNFPITFAVGARNLFNTAYRDYLDGFRYFTDETGRNLFVRLKFSLTHSK